MDEVRETSMSRAGSRRARRIVETAAAVAIALAVAGCQTNLTEQFDLAADAPDEFLVIRKQPLVMPPDMALRPPEPGAPALAGIDTSARARAGLTGAAQPAGSDATTAGEQAIVARAGAGSGSADATIRRRLQVEQSSNPTTLAEQLQREGREDGETLDAAAEAQRLRRGTAGATASAGGGNLLDSILGTPATN
jgi:hypothetical protein